MNCDFYCHILTRMTTAAAGFLPFSLPFHDEPTQIIPTLAVFPVNSCGSAAAFFQCRSPVCMHVLITSLSLSFVVTVEVLLIYCLTITVTTCMLFASMKSAVLYFIHVAYSPSGLRGRKNRACSISRPKVVEDGHIFVLLVKPCFCYVGFSCSSA